jgi:hypothetical protein
VDDTLIVLPAHPRQLHCLKEILDVFATATRLHINFHKNTFVPIHVEADDAAELTAILGYPVAGFPQSYLGLPLSNGKISASVLDLLAVKVARSFPGRRTSLLTSADRLTLASAVLTAQSLYAMAALSLPATTLQRIDRPGKGLFWKGVLKYFGGDCLVACRDVEDSGVGLKDLATLNSALLLKHLHKLFSRESNSWTDWVRLWYDNGFAEDHTPCRRALKALIPQYRAVTMVVLDDGQMDSFWHDAWVEARRLLVDVLPTLYSHCVDPDATVVEIVSVSGLTPDALQPRLSTTARHELALLEQALTDVVLRERPNARRMASFSTAVCSSALYAALRGSVGGPPMSEINWDSFAPKKGKPPLLECISSSSARFLALGAACDTRGIWVIP